MTSELLEQAVKDVAPLSAVLVTAMPDCLLYDSWVKEEGRWAPEEVASYFGDLVRSNREALKSLGSWSSTMQVTIESADALVVLREVNEHFVCGCIFDRSAPLGLVRLHVDRMLDRISAGLPQISPEEQPRAVRIIGFLRRYAPDPHAILMRVALRTGLSLEQLEAPEHLTPEQTQSLEDAAKQILGLQELHL